MQMQFWFNYYKWFLFCINCCFRHTFRSKLCESRYCPTQKTATTLEGANGASILSSPYPSSSPWWCGGLRDTSCSQNDALSGINGWLVHFMTCNGDLEFFARNFVWFWNSYELWIGTVDMWIVQKKLWLCEDVYGIIFA